MSGEAGRPWPMDLEFSADDRALKIAFDDGARFAIPYELLRVASPSAEVRGHRAQDAKLVSGKKNVGVSRAEPVGRYAVRIVFDDGHDSGLYAWDLLYELGRDGDRRLRDYFDQLEKAGLRREA
ncbi:MAG: gamma-butyrobetaine hydroxylase-like domain-containing protein [Hyphomonadaceae bacterium]